MSVEGGTPLLSSAAPAAVDSPGTTTITATLSNSSPCTSATRQAVRPRSLLDLDDDVFNYVCSYVPANDLLRGMSAASWETRRRVSANYALWQQLWMRYLLFFCNSLISATAPTASSASSSAPSAPELCTAALSDMMGMFRTNTSAPHSHNSVWYLYHFHRSAEEKPHVVHLEKLYLVREDITDPAAAAAPTSHRASSEFRTAEIHAQLLSFAQTYATQTVTRNLTHLTVPSSPSSPSSCSSPSDRPEGVPWGETVAQRSLRHVRKQQQQQADRLQRVLHFLLSTSGHRPRFHDRLWGATNEAAKEFIRQARTEAGSTTTKPTKRRNPLSPSSSHTVTVSPPPPVRLRPMSWLDDQETSVKVLLFDDDTRSVGDAAAVEEARSKLLASIAKNWRTAYASHFYPSMTDGNDPGSPLPRPPMSPSLGSATASGTAGGRTAPPVPGVESGRQHQQSLNRGHATWEQVYRRFRDGNSAAIRGTARMQQRAAARRDVGNNDDDDTVIIPSSSNPLFDLHLLGYEKRKQVYAAMLASTVEVPDGMGAFFGTCVSESFLRWWCWRNRRRADAKQAPVALSTGAVGDDERRELPVRRHIALAPFTPPPDDVSLPRSLWVVQVAARGSRGDIGSNEAEGESVAYSSSYSDLTTTASNASSNMPASSSISFAEEREEENRLNAAEGTGALEAIHAVAVDEEPHFATPQVSSSQPPPTLLHHTPVALLFPLPHMLTYWFMMHHVSFYSHQVYRRMWGDQELTVAVWSRIISPTGHSVECRLFYSLRCATFPRMFTKMMFTPGLLPLLTLQGKMAERSPYCSSSSSSSQSPSSPAHSNADAGGATSKSSSASTAHRPVDSRQIYDLFWTGFGRVEVDSGPTISRSNMMRLRIALGLPADFPMGLLWNLVMFASGIGPLILKEHRHSMHFNYDKTFTDVVADEFGDVACFGLGAQWPSKKGGVTAMVNPLDTDVALRERHTIATAAPAAQYSPLVRVTDGSHRETFEAGEQAGNELGGAHHGTPATSASLTDIANWSWNLDSEFSSAEGYWSQPGSDVSSSGNL
ncbi:hypothetical protein LSCM4_07240 [Leishmania orientalis]|uniref:F-box domain-containing protein n=1 Tax=Leishmania orientalis TaxID=2249476 RepID=A0A836GZH5_9TRYP|nr:hypothetical protein LSCM4_07240 [Leishmania orientalis]